MYKKIIDIFFLALLFEGVVRKWILPDADFIVQVIRDSLPLVALLSYHMEGNKIRVLSLLHPGPRFFFVTYVAICFLSIESLVNQPYVYLVGFRTHFAFIPLMIIAPSYLGSLDEARKRARRLAILAMPIFFLALFQNTQDATSEWNRYSQGLEGLAEFGGVTAGSTVRASGTFTYISGLQLFACFMASLCACLALSATDIKDRLLYVAGVLGGVAGVLASGSRGGLLIVVLQLVLLLTLGVLNSALHAPRLVWTSIVLVFVAPFATRLLGLQISAFEGRTVEIGYDEPVDRIYQVLLEWIEVGILHPIGNGLGAGHQAFIASLTYAQNYWEVDLSRIAFEIGLPGVVAYIVCKGALTWQIIHGVRRDPSPENRLLRIFCATTCLIGILNGSLYAPVGNALYWLAAGIGLWCLQRSGQTVSRSSPMSFGSTLRQTPRGRRLGRAQASS